MNNPLPAIVLLLTAITTFAQNPQTSLSQGSLQFPGLPCSGRPYSNLSPNAAGAVHFNSQFTPAARTTTTNAIRLIALTDLSYDGTAYQISDSSTYSYSGSRGSYIASVSQSITKYDNLYQYNYDLASGIYSAARKSSQTFDANNNVTAEVGYSWLTATGSWRNSYQYLWTYDGMNNRLSETDESWDTAAGAWVNNGRYIFTYTSANNMASETDLTWITATSTWQNVVAYIYSYTSTNKLATTRVLRWNTATSAWDSTLGLGIYSYNSGGDLDTFLRKQWDTSTNSWINQSEDIYTYDAMNNLTGVLLQSWNIGTHTWVKTENILQGSYAGRQPWVITYQSWDSASSAFVNTSRDNYTVNSYNQPTYYYSQNWDAASGTWKPGYLARRYYYEAYVSGVSNVSNIHGTAIVYPVPAKGNANIDIKWDEPQEFTISLLDMLGKSYRSQVVPICSRYVESMPLDNMPAGNYLLKMEGAKGKIVKQITIGR
jgi:hypothetical protein